MTSESQGHANGGGLRDVPVLVVEDDPASAKLLSFILEREGCHVRVATSAEEALTTMTTFRPRAIVLDLVLPRMSGILLAEQLSARPEGHDLVIVAVSAFNGPEAVRVAEKAGCAAYVRKPIDVDTFPGLLRDLLHRAHAGGRP